MNNQLQLLVDIEAITSLKARYFGAMDSKYWIAHKSKSL